MTITAMRQPASILIDMRRLAVTFTLALATGWLFLQTGMPAPYLMGSLFGVWFTGAAIRPLLSLIHI